MKTSKIWVLFLTAAVISFLVAACFSDWTGEEEYGTVSIRLAGDTSRQLVALDPATSGTTTETHTYELSIDGGAFLDFIPNSTISLTNGSHTFEIRAYAVVGIDIWFSGSPWASGTKVLRAIGTSGTVTTSAPSTTVTIDLYSATEVENWEQLKFAAGGTSDPARKEIIILRPQSSTPNTWDADAATGTITIDRPIELIAYNDVTIKRLNAFGAFFNISSTGNLTIGSTFGDKISSPITLDGGFIAPNGGVTATAQLISSSGTCTIGKDVTLQKNKNSGDGGGVSVLGGNITLYGKIIDNITVGTGGGVYVANGTFTMNGGSIIGNKAQGSFPSANGGGVYMSGGNVVMGNALIKDNEADNGGGVYMDSALTAANKFTMNVDAVIEGNVGGLVGGGVYMNAGTFEMNAGAITGNGGSGFNQSQNGGGVAMFGGTFNMKGDASISNNSVSTNGGGVYLEGGTFEASGGSIANNVAPGDGGGVYVKSGGIVKLTTEPFIGENQATNGGGVYMDGAGSQLIIFVGDAAIGRNGKPNRAVNGGGVYVKDGNFTMAGGTITYNVATTSGGGVYVDGGTFDTTGAVPTHGELVKDNSTPNVQHTGGSISRDDGSFTSAGTGGW